MTVKHFTNETFDRDVIDASYHQSVLVDFWAAWCGPCRLVGPTIDKVAASLGDQAVVGKVNIDEHGELAERFGITSIPTVLVFRDGTVVDSLVGVRSEADYIEAHHTANSRAA